MDKIEQATDTQPAQGNEEGMSADVESMSSELRRRGKRIVDLMEENGKLRDELREKASRHANRIASKLLDVPLSSHDSQQPAQGEEIRDMKTGEYATGKNPNYKGKPKKRWNMVEVVAEVGTEFGIIEDSELGLLTLITRREGEDWPHGMKPEAGMNKIEEGRRVYVVINMSRS